MRQITGFPKVFSDHDAGTLYFWHTDAFRTDANTLIALSSAGVDISSALSVTGTATFGDVDVQSDLGVTGNTTLGSAASYVSISSTGDLTFNGGSRLLLPEITTPDAEANSGQVYPKANNDLYFQDGAGNEHRVALTDLNIEAVSAATHTLAAGEDVLHVTRTAAGSLTITLPTALVTAGRHVLIKDSGGNASGNNITIETQGAETINGDADAVLVGDYDAINLYAYGSNWFTY